MNYGFFQHSSSLLALWLFLSLLFLPGVSAAAQQPSGDEKFLLDAANRERAERGTAPLKWDPALAEAAQRHLREMIRHNTISHRFAGEDDLKSRASAAGARFSAIAENVAEAPDVASIHINWMLSPGHSANILSPHLDSIGIAVAKSGEEYFAVQDFAAAVAALSREEQERKVGELLGELGLRVSKDPEDARRACRRGGGLTGPQARGVAHFESPDLDKLPDGVLKMIRGGHFAAAAVGACDPGDKGGFATYRVALVFY